MAVDFFSSEVINKQYLLNVEYKVGGVEYVTLSESVSKEDIAQQLISEGLVSAEARKEKHLKEVVDKYKKAEEQAKKSRVIYSLNGRSLYFWNGGGHAKFVYHYLVYHGLIFSTAR